MVTTSLEGAQVVDARRTTDFEAAHIPGSLHLSGATLIAGEDETGAWGALADAELVAAVEAAGIQDDEPVVLVGAGQAGWGDDGDVYWVLRYLGHEDVRVYNGGWSAWLAAGGDIEAGPGDAEASHYQAELAPSVLAGTEEVASWSGSIVDVRSSSEWSEGHVPGAIHLEWTDVFADDAVLLPEEEVGGILARAGIVLEDDEDSDGVVVYCRRGVRAGHSFMVLDALARSRGLELRVANYVGSWTRWTEEGGEVELP